MSMTGHREIPFGKPWITEAERQAVLAVLDGPVLTDGPQTRAFEEEFTAFAGKGGGSVATSSCTAALHLSYLALDIGTGDEVIVPAQTHVATAHAVEFVGARPVFVDCDLATGNINAEQAARAITPRTKAISVVHYAGIPCGMSAIIDLAERHGLRVVEDCALAVGSLYKGTHAGLLGDVGCFSFYPVKHMTTGEGGMAICQDPALAQRIHKLRAFGVDRSHTERTIPGVYDVLSLGLNYRMSELQAALGRQQLVKVPEILRLRAANFALLKSLLQEAGDFTVLDAVDGASMNSFYCLIVVLRGALAERRNEMVRLLNEAGVGTSVYYPHPVPRLTYYRNKYGYEGSAFPNATTISDCSIALPVGPHVTEEDAHYIGETFRQVWQGII